MLEAIWPAPIWVRSMRNEPSLTFNCGASVIVEAVRVIGSCQIYAEVVSFGIRSNHC